MMRWIWFAATLVLLLCPWALAGEEAERQAKARDGDAWRPSKEDLASWLKPIRLHDTPFYGRVGAARWQGQRRTAEDGRTRLLLELRILGPLDGAT